MEIEDVVRELYGLDLDGFVARRNELAKQVRRDGDRDLAARIGSLRKPSIAAWALNQLARSHADGLARLDESASSLREAQASGDAATLRERSKDGQRSVRSLVTATAEIAAGRERPLASGAIAEVEQSLRDALGDEDVLAAIREGSLVDPPRSAGLGAFGIDGGDAGLTAFGPVRGADRSGEEVPDGDAVDRRRRARERAIARIEEIRGDHERAEADLDVLDHQLADLDEERARLVEQLEALDARRPALQERRRRLEERTNHLADDLSAATRELDALDQLDGR